MLFLNELYVYKYNPFFDYKLLLSFNILKDFVSFNFNYNLVILMSNLIYIIMFMMLSIIFIFLFFYFLRNLNKRSNFLLNQYLLFFFQIIEKEIINMNNKIKLFLIFILFIIIYNIDFILFNGLSMNFALNFQFLICLIVIVLLIPLNLIYSYGLFFLSYIRGASLKKNIFFETVYDSLNLISFFLRINIQFVRIFLINFMFLMFEEIYYELIYPFYNINTLNVTNVSIIDYINFSLNYFLVYFFKFMYEIGHFWVIFSMQSNVFCLIVTYLIQFLYCSYTLSKMINYFRFKKTIL